MEEEVIAWQQPLRRHRHRRRPQRPDRRPPISRAPARRSCVLERREVVGGAAVTEEIFPGYRFTEFSYVVSLLRPEIIRDLELPRHGLKILPLPSTVTPMDNGDYLAAWDDHDLTRREIYRHSPRDAEASDEYGRVMARAAKAIKPVLSLVPPDPSSMSARATCWACSSSASTRRA